MQFDINDERHVKFVLSYANLMAVALGIPENRNVAEVTKMASAAPSPAYVPKKIEVKLEENKNNEQQ